MAYPSSIDTDAVSAGTSPLSSPDHSNRHNTVGSAMIAVETVLGTNSGTAILKNFTAGKFAVSDNAGTLNNAIVGTPRITGGTASSFILGTSTIQGGTVANAVIGTSTVQGGTLASNIISSPTVSGGVFTSGTINGATLGTPTIGTIAVSGTVAPLSVGAGLAPTTITLTDAPSGTIALNAQAGQIFHMILGTTAGNRAFGTPTNPTEGQAITFRLKQNSNNTGTIVWPSIYRFNENGTPTLGTTSSYNYYGWRYNTVDTKWDFQGNSRGIV